MSGAAVNRGTTQIQCIAPSSSNKLLTLTQSYGNAYSQKLSGFCSGVIRFSGSYIRFHQPRTLCGTSPKSFSVIAFMGKIQFYKVYNRTIGLSIVFLNLFFKHRSAVRINSDCKREILEAEALDALAAQIKKGCLLALGYAL